MKIAVHAVVLDVLFDEFVSVALKILQVSLAPLHAYQLRLEAFEIKSAERAGFGPSISSVI